MAADLTLAAGPGISYGGGEGLNLVSLLEVPPSECDCLTIQRKNRITRLEES